VIHFPDIASEIQSIPHEGIELSILREDKIHPEISGNKFRKLKYNLAAFTDGDFDSLLTFGGAYSNHIAAVAAAGKEFGFQSIGIIRGEELASKVHENPTLKFAQNCGMKLKFISREAYRQKTNPLFLEELQAEFGKVYVLPEGGTNEWAVKGCTEILGAHTSGFDFICCAVGTGGTLAGLIRSAENHQRILGFPALKDSDFLKDEINRYVNRSNWELIQEYHFGGYGKVCPELINFTNDFKNATNIQLDPVYTSKMLFGVSAMAKAGYFPKGSRVLAIHTGGLQGVEGMNKRLKRKNKTILK